MNIVDTREPQTIIEPLQESGWWLAKLDYGDYQLDCGLEVNPLVERKAVSDLLHCLQDGTLVRQCRNLCEATPFPVLLIEGAVYLEPDGIHLRESHYLTKQALRNQLMSLQNLGCRIERTDNIADTIGRLNELVAYFSKDSHESVLRQMPGNYRINTLCLIPGIGQAKAQAILTVFPTLKAVANASVQVLTDCPGIGYKLAQKIFQWFNMEEING